MFTTVASVGAASVTVFVVSGGSGVCATTIVSIDSGRTSSLFDGGGVVVGDLVDGVLEVGVMLVSAIGGYVAESEVFLRSSAVE